MPPLHLQDPLFLMLPGKFGRLVRGLKKWICVVGDSQGGWILWLESVEHG